MTPPRIMCVDDDSLIREVVRATLERAGFELLLADGGAKALELWRENPVDLIVLDVMMPGINGLDLCRYIRTVSDVPVMMLTARDNEEDIIRGFEAGADDYIVKPFRPKELVARIRAILQRSGRPAVPAGNRLVYNGLVLDTAAQRVTRGEEVVPTTALEFRLLQYLVQRHDTVVSKEELFQNVWGYAMPAGGMNLIEVAVRRLREKVEPDPSRPQYIQTVRGAGYRFGI